MRALHRTKRNFVRLIPKKVEYGNSARVPEIWTMQKRTSRDRFPIFLHERVATL